MPLAASSTGCTRGGRDTSVTTSRLGTTAAGQISTAIAFASCFDRWKNWGKTTALFSGVMTRATSSTTVMHNLPSRRGSTISGYLWTRCVATLR